MKLRHLLPVALVLLASIAHAATPGPSADEIAQDAQQRLICAQYSARAFVNQLKSIQMSLRTRHLALLLLLFSSLSPAESRALCPKSLSAGGRYVSMLLSQRAAAANTETLITDNSYNCIETLDLPAASLSQHSAIWAMRPPAAHCTQVEAATSFAS